MKTLNRTVISCASIGICIALIGTPAQAVNVDMIFNIPVVGRIDANFIGFDFNRNGYIRSSEGEVQSATAQSSYGVMYFPGADPGDFGEGSGIDIEYYYWATSISPNIIDTQINRFNIKNEYISRIATERNSFYYTGGEPYPGYPQGLRSSQVNFEWEYKVQAIFRPALGTEFHMHSESDSDFLQTMSSTGSLVPEPSTYAMLLAGLGALGFVARRRKG